MNAALGHKSQDHMPAVKGRLTPNAPLHKYSWFRTGGPADMLFEPADSDDLAEFLSELNEATPVTVIGVGSNLLVRDGGVRGVVIRLGRFFTDISVDNNSLHVGAGAMDVHVARAAADAGIAGLEFLVGVPGTIGGALRMNAGAYGREMADCLVTAGGITRRGEMVSFSANEMGFSYRKSAIDAGVIFTHATLIGTKGEAGAIKADMREIMVEREASQPIGTRTGGSTFKNPDPATSGGRSAWQLIDAAGCRDMRIGGAGVSEKHCNFLINYGDARAADIEELGETVRRKVAAATGVKLQWEIRRIGEAVGDNI